MTRETKAAMLGPGVAEFSNRAPAKMATVSGYMSFSG
jgi:hypothetical protein